MTTTAAPSRLGVMGGTFDPIHNGHLIVAEEARQAFDLDEVLFVPTGVPWQKSDRVVTDPEERYLMCQIATASNPHFVVSRHEIDRCGPTYTVDTLRELRDQHGPDGRLYFITGADAVLQILTWKDPEEAVELATFIAATRPGHDLSGLEALPPAVRRRVVPLQVPGIAVSSTLIRERVGAGRPVRYLVPDDVESYIVKRRLYSGA